MAANGERFRIAAVSPRSFTWPAPRPRGGCCPPESLPAGRRRRHGAVWTSGPRLGYSSNSTWRCWTGSVWRAGWTGRARVWQAAL